MTDPKKQGREPLMDIVILVHDKADWADLCIRSVETHTRNPYRLILVDMASQEAATKKLFEETEGRGHTVIHLNQNRSFSGGVNVGVERGDAKFIVILNDDAIVTEGWDTALLQDASVKQTGLVGARSNLVAGPQGDPSFIGEPPYLCFVCVCLRRAIWDVIGPMDEETFDGFSSEDIDYSWRVKKAGYNLKISNAFVLHAGSRTLIKTHDQNGNAEAVQQALALNNQKYNIRLEEKWGKQWVKDHTKTKDRVLIATYHGEEWTRVDFMGAFAGLKRADGVTFEYFHCKRLPIHQARKALCDYALDKGFDVLIQLDDDATFPGDLVRRLLSHQKEVVCALAYQRKPPHLTCAFELGPEGLLGAPMENIEHTGLRRVDVSGFHCSLLRTSVIQKLRDGLKDADGKVIIPGTRDYFGGFENKLGEDFAFCVNLKKIGVQVHCDTELISGHIGQAINVDERYKREWVARGSPMI